MVQVRNDGLGIGDAVNISVNTKGLEAVIARLAPLNDADMLRVMTEVDHKARQQVNQTFQAGRDPISGAQWKPTSNFTLSLRFSGGGQTMVARGGDGLFGSIVGRSPEVTPSSVKIGTGKIYGPIHQNGGIIRPVKAKALALPLTKEAARAGSPRRFPRPLFVPRGIPGLAESTRGGKGLKMQYRFMDQVKIPMRRFLGVSRSGPNYAGQLQSTVLATISRIILARGNGANE